MAFKKTDQKDLKMRNTYIAIMIPLGIAINLVGGQIATQLKIPLFMDSIGTAIVAAIMGPYVGAVSGVMYNIISSIIGGNIVASLFGLVNIATAFVVGFAARSGKFVTWIQALVVTIATGFVNAIMGAPIAMVVYGGIQGSGIDLVTAGLLAMGQDMLTAAFLARIPTNLADKGIAVFVAWIILKRLPDNMKNLSGANNKK